MNIGEVRELIKALGESSLGHIEVDDGALRISLSRASELVPCVSVPRADAAVANGAISTGEAEASPSSHTEQRATPQLDGHTVTSTLVGRIRLNDKNGRSMIARGNEVQQGQVVAIIDVLKQPYEVTAPRNGRVIEIFVQEGAVVEYGQPLFIIG